MPPPFTPMQIPSNILLQQKQGTAIMIWAIGAFVNHFWLDPMMLVNKTYIASAYLVGNGSCFYLKSINGSGRNLWMYALILHHLHDVSWNWSIGTSEFKRPIYWCVWLSMEFSLNPDGFGYLTFQLTDILGYSSTLIWLSCTNILNCCTSGFHSLWRSSRMFGVPKHATVRKKIFTIRSMASNTPFIDVYLWEPVGALISTVLSQMILGHRVYTVCCL